MRTTLLTLASAASVYCSVLPTTSDELIGRQVIGQACTDIRIFVARGTGEGYAEGTNTIEQYFVPAVCNGRDSCDYADIPYPAATTPQVGNYCTDSEQLGVQKAVQQITNHMNECPGTKMVLAGYSQGAQVIADVLGGTASGGTGCNAGNGALDRGSSPGNAIAAVVLFADITRTAAQSFDYGSAGAGVSGRFGARGGASLSGLNVYADILGSYCTTNDYWCATGTDGNVHASAVVDNYQAAATFANGKLT